MNEKEPTSELKFILVRAGSTEFDDQGRILGSLDLPLSDHGMEEINRTAEELTGIPIDSILSSACQAAQQSATLIAARFGIKVKVEKKLTNLDCGLWHGKSLEELRETQPTIYKQWKEHPEQVCPPCGETMGTMQSRVCSIIKKTRKRFLSGVVVMVAPEPLLSVIRNELHVARPDEKPHRLQCGQWEIIDADQAMA
jgi:phosphoserine phosphatase